MTTSAGQGRNSGDSQLYEIRLQGLLESRWAGRLEGMTFTHESDGTTSLTGLLVDQSALHGLLAQIRDLGMPIVSVRRLCRANHTEQEEGNQ